jgi:DMSO/TMAO reductase YedYZ molybdopterin-dependent catalytic subunit
MSNLSRRKLITAGLAATASVSGLTVAHHLAERYGLLPPDDGGIYGPGKVLTYASQRLLTRNVMAREFPRGQISAKPFPNTRPPETEQYKSLRADGFMNWGLTVDGMVARPRSFSLSELMRYPSRSQITQLVCEEGWSFIAEWIGVPLSHVLNVAGVLPNAKYVVYSSMEPGWRDSIDMADALHPQTLVTYAMNGGDLPPGHGGPLRLRVPRQLGYKSVKYLTGLTVAHSVRELSEGSSYAWYAGI